MKTDPLLNRIKADFNLPSSEVLNSNIYSALDDLAENPTYVGVVNYIQYDYKESTESSETFLMKLEKYRINYGDIVTNESVALQVKNPSSGVLSLLGTFGNFSLVKGKQKSRKSFFINLIISSILKTDTSRGIISASEDSKQNILYIDTEQGKSHVTMANNRIWENSVSDEHHRLHTYALRSMSPAERLESIETLIKKIDKLGFVVIDGIKDLVTSVNDEVEASKIASKLLKWSEEFNIHIMVVLHENPSSTKARGHLGTELTNKAETIIAIEVDSKKPDVSIVKPASCRNIPFESFAISVNDSGLPFILEGYHIKGESKSMIALNDLEDDKKFRIITKAFDNKNVLGYQELVTEIKRVLDEVGFKRIKTKGVNRIKELITHAIDKTMITKEGMRQPHRLNQQFIDS